MTKKTRKHASADVGLILTAYNLRRLLNLIDRNEFKQYLQALALFFHATTTHFKGFYRSVFWKTNQTTICRKLFFCSLNQLYLR